MNLRQLLPAVMLLLAPAAGVAGPLGIYVTSTVHDCAFATDDTVRVDVMFNSIDRVIDVAGLHVTYTPAALGFVRAERGDLISAWTTFTVTPGAPGDVALAASNGTPMPTGISGQFARLVFVNTNCGFTHTEYVCPTQFSGDLVGPIVNTCGSVRIVAGDPGTITVESINRGCGSAEGDTIEVDVRVENASQPVDAAGLDVSFDDAVLEYVGYKRGDLTADWPFFDAALVVHKVRVGGFTDTPIPGGTSGVFVTLRFVANCCEVYRNASMCSSALVDDFAGMGTGCGNFQCVPLKTRASNWGYVKSIYR